MRFINLAAVCMVVAAGTSALAQPLTSAFTYQGEIRDGGSLSNGPVDLHFRLYDAQSGGLQIGSVLQFPGTALSDGRFTATLDFGAVFSAQSRWLEIDVRPAGTGVYSTLAPRQLLGAAPVASFALTIPAQYNTFNSSGGNAVFTVGNVGIGTASPAAGLHVTRTQGGMSFNASDNLFVNDTQDFVGVNRATRSTSAEVFGLQNTASQTGFVGMYIASSSASGLPFYGYRTPSTSGWTEMDDAGTWKVFNGGGYRLGLSASGNLGLGGATATPAFPLHIQTGVQTATQIESSNGGGTWLNLSNTASGRTWSAISTGSTNAEGPGKWLLRDATANAVRIAVDTSGNVGIGTTSPGVRLDVSGTVRTTGGVVFPDGSTQVRSANVSALTSSGLPGGSTFTVTIGGIAATLAGEYKMTHIVAPSGLNGTYAYTSANIASGGAIRVRRARTADSTWAGWVTLNTARTLNMVLTVPGGATVTWSGAMTPVATNIVQSGGVLLEELELAFGQGVPLSRVVNGAPAVSTPSGDLAGVALLLNGSQVQNISFINTINGTRISVDAATGLPAGNHRGPTFRVRANPFSNQILYPRFATASNQTDPAIISGGGGTIASSTNKFYTEYVLTLADDGLPIEEFGLAMDPS